jgi:phosphoribosyl 1,2-cyclic phosphate phosphodiesterase
LSHCHEDHFYAGEFFCRFPGFLASRDEMKALAVVGNKACYERLPITDEVGEAGKLRFELIAPGDERTLSGITVTAFTAHHDDAQTCMVYMLAKDNKAFFYGHDSGYYPEETWTALQGKHLDLVLLDCTHGRYSAGITGGHQGFPENIKVRERMLSEGIADENTIFCLTHFSHNGHADYDEMVALAVPQGFTVAYDGIAFHI